MKGKLTEIVEKYKLPLLVLTIGIFLLLLPWKKGETENKKLEQQEAFSLERTEEKMEDLLGNMSGVGRVKVMLTLKSGSALQLAENSGISEREKEKKQDTEVVKLNRGSGVQDVVITKEIYPIYQGAVVICDGAENSATCLSVMEAVATLTGLSSDKITVAKWNNR